jgi:hypothetical protein
MMCLAEKQRRHYVALIAFEGARCEELQKGLIGEAINFAPGYIIVSAAIAKTGRGL